MKIAVIGASGSVGSRIVSEALSRGHQVTGIARHPERIAVGSALTAVAGDVTQPEALASCLKGHDVVVSSVRFLSFDVADLLRALSLAGKPRLVMVGGAGSLLTPSGGLVFESPTFPEQGKANSSAGARMLAHLRQQSDIDWTFISPSLLFRPGERTGRFREGQDHLLIGEDGESRISQEDYAVALLDEIETPRHRGRRYTVGY